MKKIAFITGILGQDGPYLAELLLDRNYRVYGLIKDDENPDFSNTDYLGVTKGIKIVRGDMGKEESLQKLIKKIKPDEVYNLAALSFAGGSWDKARETTEVNALGVLYLLNAIRNNSPHTRFYQASTSEMYGKHNCKVGKTEETPFHPCNPYAISKLYGYWITVNFRESYGMYCTNGILFNHESPIRGKQFVTRKISDGVARIKMGLDEEIQLGNLDSKRDWGFAGDYVEAMWLMLQQKEPKDYVISTGKTHSIRDFLDIAFRHVGIKDWEKYVKIDSKFKRPVELFSLHGKSDKAKKELGWEPKMNFHSLVKIMVDADLARYTAMTTPANSQSLQPKIKMIS